MVLDDKKGGTLIDEAVEQSDEEGDIVEVKTGGGFIEDEKRRSVGGNGRVFVAAFLGSFFFFFLGGQMSDKFKSLGFASRELAERLATTKVTESDFGEESEGGDDFLVALAGAWGEVIAWSEMKQGLGSGHFEEFMNRLIEVAGEEDVGLKALAFASGACDENVR